MEDRAAMIQWLRGELVGPSQPLSPPTSVSFAGNEFVDAVALRTGPLAWQPSSRDGPQEVLYFDGESPHRKYGAGLLHPADAVPDDYATAAASVNDPGFDRDANGSDADGDAPIELESDGAGAEQGEPDPGDEFEIASIDARFPSTIGVSLCIRLGADGRIIVKLPKERRFAWQDDSSAPFALNGRYERVTRRWTNQNGVARSAPLWRRMPVGADDCRVEFEASTLSHGKQIGQDLPLSPVLPMRLRVDLFPRRLRADEGLWLITVVLRNTTSIKSMTEQQRREAVLFQTLFEVRAEGGSIERYPESGRPFEQLDRDEQSLALLYRESGTWGIGHGCAAGWDADPGGRPDCVYADVMPAVELPSMTPDIELEGRSVQLSMRDLSALTDDGSGGGWASLERLVQGYRRWIEARRHDLRDLPGPLAEVGDRHLRECEGCLVRIETGVQKLREDGAVRHAFRLANLSMLLQQVATKQLEHRPLEWDATQHRVRPSGPYRSAWDILQAGAEDAKRLGTWRAFQAAFLLMSIVGSSDTVSEDRSVVDLIWFPTGGGKTEAYLAVIAFYMFHQRLLMVPTMGEPRRDGTNVLMRYTLRMLTTQQFQRAASLVCAMEFLRRNAEPTGAGTIPGRRFSLGLWIGGDGSPNKIAEAKEAVGRYLKEKNSGNPLVLTECPWCRAAIGRFDGPKPKGIDATQWSRMRLRGIQEVPKAGLLLLCPDGRCLFGGERHDTWLPVEVIDERIYDDPPSLVIATADKLAMVAYRPKANALFGKRLFGDRIEQDSWPPGLIVQDELHLISGPLGTMYALYEGIFERLCTSVRAGVEVRPKIIASTATIRGADAQVLALYGRERTQLFPSPGLAMGDSFFGRYARDERGRLRRGRLYLGIHASNFGSVLTTQTRAFSAALFRPAAMAAERRDPWWTLLAFYNSIRELGGAKTLFDSDIRSRVRFIFNREGFPVEGRRALRIVDELTSRLSQSEIVHLMNQLSLPFGDSNVIDACLASNIIEVGVDIDRLSLMSVVGQPKTTATYIQVTGRVGRRWWERPGLILTIYNPAKTRDRSHFEQFHAYHRRLYERVEPTTATPFALSAIQRGLPGALIAWARANCVAPVSNFGAYEPWVREGRDMLIERSLRVQRPEDVPRSQLEIKRVVDEMLQKWQENPQDWEEFPQDVHGEYLMLWPGQYATGIQRRRGLQVPSSMRQVDASAELAITQGYEATDESAPTPGDQGHERG